MVPAQKLPSRRFRCGLFKVRENGHGSKQLVSLSTLVSARHKGRAGQERPLAMSQQEKRRIQAKLPAGTRPLVLKTQVWPDELRRTVAEALK
jgi:hypothetical protein